jgi:hypothetical protein
MKIEARMAEPLQREQPVYYYKGRPVSLLGLRLSLIREQIDAAAARGEIQLLNTEELERLLDDLRPSDPDIR